MRQFLVVLIMIIGTTSVSAQVVYFDRQYDSLLFQQQVSTMDEFMDRFNGEEQSKAESQDSLSRLRNLFHVCNRDALELQPERWYTFLSDLAKDSVHLLYTNSNWAAIATCIVDYEGVEDTIVLVLKMEQVKGSIYKWVIAQASGQLLSLVPIKKSPHFSISPVDNDVNFISLGDITEKNGQNILCYGSSNFRIDETSVFYALVACGKLKVKYVDELIYQFDVPKYAFVVSYFNRDTDNSGWLISDFFERNILDEEDVQK